jgi:hypothetical protein
MSSSPVAAAAHNPQYRTYLIRSWHEYQRITPSKHHSISHYNTHCEEHAKLYDAHILVLRENVTKITGWYMCTGWPAQNCAESDGYVDIRTGKKYSRDGGENSFFKDITRQ